MRQVGGSMPGAAWAPTLEVMRTPQAIRVNTALRRCCMRGRKVR